MLGNEIRKFQQSRKVFRRHIDIVVAGLVDPQELLGLIGCGVKRLPMPEGNNLIVAAVHDEHRAMYAAELAGVIEFVKGKKRPVGDNAKRAHKSTDYDHSADRLFRGQINRWSGAYRMPQQKNG